MPPYKSLTNISAYIFYSAWLENLMAGTQIGGTVIIVVKNKKQKGTGFVLDTNPQPTLSGWRACTF